MTQGAKNGGASGFSGGMNGDRPHLESALKTWSVPNGTYLTCFGCPFFLTSALADRRGLVSKG
jgi:hypothetical protein